jgi:DHA1 family multidrug resistance protein-like MFS transporter
MSSTSAGSIQARQAQGGRRVVVALSVSTFVEWAGAGCMMPLLPLYLRKLGAPVVLVGVVMAAFFLAAVLVQYPIGRLSDRIGRRPVQLGGLVTFAVASATFALIGTPVAALFVRGLQGAGAGVVDVANNATVGEVMDPSQQGRAYGALFGSRTVGLAIGPFIGGLAGISAMRWLFAAAALASLLACVPVLAAVPRSGERRQHHSAPRVVLWRDRSVLGVVMGYVGAGLVIGVYEVCWSLLLHLRGATGWQIGLSWTLFALPFAAMSVPGGWLVDHFDRRYLAAGSTLMSAAFAATYPFLHSVWLLVGLGAAEAVTVAVAGPALAAQLAHSVPIRQLGRAQGAGSTAQTGATAAAALVAGALFALHPWVPFVGASGAIVVLVALLGWCWRGVPGRGERPGASRGGVLGSTGTSLARPRPGSGSGTTSIGQAQATVG